jgi:hypothetical protein
MDIMKEGGGGERTQRVELGVSLIHRRGQGIVYGGTRSQAFWFSGLQRLHWIVPDREILIDGSTFGDQEEEERCMSGLCCSEGLREFSLEKTLGGRV